MDIKKVDKKSSQSVWGQSPAGTTFGAGFEPGTKQFFDNVLNKRSNYEQPWLFELVPFASFRNKKLLELGCGAGYDAYEFCRNGADYTGIDITPENPDRTKKHLAFYDLTPKVVVGDAENLMFPDKTFEVIFSNGVLHHTPDIKQSFRETYRLLKPGGEFWVILYHKNSVVHWVSIWLMTYILNGGFLKLSFKERLSMIEYSTSDELPLVNVYSRKDVTKLLKETGFILDSMWVRKFVKEDVPGLWLLMKLYPIPQTWLDYVGRFFGWYVVAKGVKPD